MGIIQKPSDQPLDRNGAISLPGMLIPSFRTLLAVDTKVDKNILIYTWGGLGDQVCAEPSIRYAFDTFKGCEISLASQFPELFSHLPFKWIFDTKKPQPKLNPEDYLVFRSIEETGHLNWEFLNHTIIQCVDYCSLNMFRCQLPLKYRQIKLVPKKEDILKADQIDPKTDIIIHAGRHWESKTFPVEWWNKVLSTIINERLRPVLIGADIDENRRGTVDVNSDGCLDLRNKLSIMESVAVLQKAKVLLSNDSSPVHLAASGNAWIGYLATVKNPDFINHWRQDLDGKMQFSWRMEDLALGGVWQKVDTSPINCREEFIHKCPIDKLMTYLPDPKDFAMWGVSKCLF